MYMQLEVIQDNKSYGRVIIPIRVEAYPAEDFIVPQKGTVVQWLDKSYRIIEIVYDYNNLKIALIAVHVDPEGVRFLDNYGDKRA